MSSTRQATFSVRLEPHAGNREHYLMVLADRFPGLVGSVSWVGDYDEAVMEGINMQIEALSSSAGYRVEVFQSVYERVDANAVRILVLTLSMVSGLTRFRSRLSSGGRSGRPMTEISISVTASCS